MNVGRIAAGAVLTGVLALSGCANTPFFRGPEESELLHTASSGSRQELLLPAVPESYAGIQAMLIYGSEISGLPRKDQAAACFQAKTRLRMHSNDTRRMTLAMIGVIVPGCIASGQLVSLLLPITKNRVSAYQGLAVILVNVGQQRTLSDQALAASRHQVVGLQDKLKAITRIETQLNQVKDRELQNLN